MSDGISDGLGGHRDWQTLWNDWNEERQKAERYYQDLNAANAEVASLRARAESAEAERDRMRSDALTAYRERYDCEDSASPADLIRTALNAERYEHDRFKARGGELDAAEAAASGLAEALREQAGHHDDAGALCFCGNTDGGEDEHAAFCRTARAALSAYDEAKKGAGTP